MFWGSGSFSVSNLFSKSTEDWGKGGLAKASSVATNLIISQFEHLNLTLSCFILHNPRGSKSTGLVPAWKKEK